MGKAKVHLPVESQLVPRLAVPRRDALDLARCWRIKHGVLVQLKLSSLTTL